MKTAEVVSPKHPDKLCDRVSDALLDYYLKEDPDSRVAIETCGGHGKVFITGEVTSKTKADYDAFNQIVEGITNIKDIQYNIVEQSPEIAQGVDIGGAGDQGIMIGYACNDNSDYLPQEYYLARELNKHLYKKWSYDGKTQVTIIGNTLRIVASFQNSKTDELKEMILNFFTQYPNYVIKEIHANPAGEWSQGGFDADAGVTGRKLAVDNYGPRVPLGGGAFSGKDPSKVDRSAAYMARRIAVDYLKDYNSQEVKVELAYAIGYDQPLQATAIIDGKRVYINDYDLSPIGIINYLDLKKPIYSKTAEWGHFSNGFSWG